MPSVYAVLLIFVYWLGWLHSHVNAYEPPFDGKVVGTVQNVLTFALQKKVYTFNKAFDLTDSTGMA